MRKLLISILTLSLWSPTVSAESVCASVFRQVPDYLGIFLEAAGGEFVPFDITETSEPPLVPMGLSQPLTSGPAGEAVPPKVRSASVTPNLNEVHIMGSIVDRLVKTGEFLRFIPSQEWGAWHTQYIRPILEGTFMDSATTELSPQDVAWLTLILAANDPIRRENAVVWVNQILYDASNDPSLGMDTLDVNLLLTGTRSLGLIEEWVLDEIPAPLRKPQHPPDDESPEWEQSQLLNLGLTAAPVSAERVAVLNWTALDARLSDAELFLALQGLSWGPPSRSWSQSLSELRAQRSRPLTDSAAWERVLQIFFLELATQRVRPETRAELLQRLDAVAAQDSLLIPGTRAQWESLFDWIEGSPDSAQQMLLDVLEFRRFYPEVR